MNSPRTRIDRLALLAQALTMIVAVWQFLRGTGSLYKSVALFISVPLLRAILFSSYRGWLRQTVADCWHACAEYRASRGPMPWRTAFLLFVLPGLALLLASDHCDGGDNHPILLMSASLLTRGTWNMEELLATPEFNSCMRLPNGRYIHCFTPIPDKGVYSSYPAGPVQFALPVAALARVIGADFNRVQIHLRLQKVTSACLAALSLALFFLLALHLVEPAPAAFTTLLLATGSAIYTTTGQGLWQHGGVIFWTLVLLLVEFRHVRDPLRRHVWIQGVACGMMFACRLAAVEVLVPFGLWVLVRSPRRAVALVAIACMAYLPWAILYQSIYGQPFGPSMSQMQQSDWWWSQVLTNLIGVLASPGRGFLIYQLWGSLVLLALLPAVRRLAARSAATPPMGWQVFCLVAIAINFALVSAWQVWWGGWSWGSRLVSDTLPLWALLCLAPIAWLWTFRPGRGMLYAIALIGFLINLPTVYLGAALWNGTPNNIDANPGRLWSWSRPPFLHPVYRKG